MAIKIDRPTVRIPTFELPERPKVTDKFHAFKPDNSTFDPAAPPGPMVMPQLPVNPAAIPGYGTPDALKDVFAELEKMPGLHAGATEEARKAALATARDTIIAAGKERGLDLMLNKKANGEFSLDAFAWRKPDGSVAVIDFALASKDLSRATKFQWLDVTNGGGASNAEPIFKIDIPDAINGIYEDIVKQWSGTPGYKAGASAADRKKTLGGMRDSLIKAGKAAGLDLGLNMKNGEAAVDSVVWKKPDGTQVVVDFAENANDLTKQLSPQWRSNGDKGNYAPAPDAA